MGTLFNQPERDRRPVTKADLDDIANDVKYLSEQHGFSIKEAVQVYSVAEMQRINMAMIDDWDRKDEQLSGFGEILNGIKDSLEEMSEKVADKA